MYKIIMYFGVLSIFMGFVSTNPAFCGMACEGTMYNNVYYKRNQPYYPIKNGVKYRCIACGSCTPMSSGKSSSMPSGKGLSSSQKMAAGILGPLLGEVFRFDDLYAPPDSWYQDALRQQHEELKKQQEMKQEAVERWLHLQAEAEAKRLNEEAERKRKGEYLLAMVAIGGESLKMESMDRGVLTRFEWDTPKALEPAPSGQYKTSEFTEMERLLCSAYFSKMAESAVNSGDLEGARFYGTQMDHVIQGYPTATECKPPKEISTTADVKKIGELNQKYTRMATVYKEIMPKIENLQEIEIKLGEGKKKREESEQKILELDKQIEEIKARIQSADVPEQKAQEVDLLALAMALKSDAEKQRQEAVQAEVILIKEKRDMENDLNALSDRMRAGGQK